MAKKSRARRPSRVGKLLRYWRNVRRKSQLALSLDAQVSARHVSFIETGRTDPSRDMVLSLANALDVPLRERNDLLLAAGFAPVFGESALDAPEMAPARQALEQILKKQEPYPAVVLDRHWNMVKTNAAAPRFFGLFLDDSAPNPPNVLRLMFHPKGLRPHVANWERVAETLIRRVHREALGGVTDEGTAQLLEEVLGYRDVPPRFRMPDLTTPLQPVVPIDFRKGEHAFQFFSMVTTLGTPQDVTLQELRIESFFPANTETEFAIERLTLGD